MSESLIYVTCESDEEARKIGTVLVRERLVACVNILGGVKSLYWWDGEVQQGEEVVLIAKTRKELVDEVTSKVSSLHSYEVPCVVALPLVGGNAEFLSWLRDETCLR